MKGSVVKVTTICDNCGKETKSVFKDYWDYTNGLSDPYYCKNCNYIKSEKTNLDRWGHTNPMKCDEIKDRLKKSMVDKWGVEYYSQTKQWKDQFSKTSLENWGVDNPFKSDEIKEKIQSSNLKNNGVKWPMQSDSIREKSKSTCLENWGVDIYSKSLHCKNKIVQTNLKNWGVSNPMKSDEIKQKIKQINFEKWGDHPLRLPEIKDKSKSVRQGNTFNKYSVLLGKEYNFYSYDSELFKIHHKECENDFDIYKGLLLSRYKLDNIICTKCNPIGVQYSSIELEVRLFLDGIGIQYLMNDKSILGGSELDIFIPSHNLAIEVNGVYWHSELFKDKNYHLQKTNECDIKGINLIHIWEDDWKRKKDIIKSILVNRLGVSGMKIYARKCGVKEVDSKSARKFLDENHIQGFASSTIKIGLFHKDELVSLMTFGWRRTNNKREYELIRFCNKIGTTVVGSASKIFSYFLNNNSDIEQIVSYADISMFKGSLYKTLGFEKVGISNPNYFWVIDGVRKHRYNFSKRKLVNEGYDPTKTEVEIMHERGYYRVFSTGQERWIFVR